MKEHKIIYKAPAGKEWILFRGIQYYLSPLSEKLYERGYSINNENIVIKKANSSHRLLAINDTNNWGHKQRIILANIFES